MADYETIRAPSGAVSAAREAKNDGETWGEYLLRCAGSDVPKKWTQAEIEDVVRDEVQETLREMRR
jgi:hypothetical protein